MGSSEVPSDEPCAEMLREGDRVGVFLDRDANTLAFAVNGHRLPSQLSLPPGVDLYPAIGLFSSVSNQ